MKDIPNGLVKQLFPISLGDCTEIEVTKVGNIYISRKGFDTALNGDILRHCVQVFGGDIEEESSFMFNLRHLKPFGKVVFVVFKAHLLEVDQGHDQPGHRWGANRAASTARSLE